ncbi:MAG: E3 ubiquitin ligase family protein [Kaiparowitsia implicata GSE-PSE-MK54-09C]|nr:E3 ubiquitin ligase family protein [Kaiparowitsia implicata GSE-PSE-MK54-09C]
MGFIIAGIVFGLASLGLAVAKQQQQQRALSLKAARAVTVTDLTTMAQAIAQEIGGGSWREYVKLSGEVVCDRPLISELKQAPCVFYRMSVKREYEETVTTKGSDGKSTQETRRSSETVASNEQSTPFLLRDRTGTVLVNPSGAQLDSTKLLDEFQPGQPKGLISYGRFSRVPSRLTGLRHTLGYRYTESVLPLHSQVTVVATVADREPGLVLEKPLEGDRPFIISLKTDEALTKSAEQTAQRITYGMWVCGALGVGLVVVGLLR